MKSTFKISVWLLLCLFPLALIGQQSPTSLFQRMEKGWANPGYVPLEKRTEVLLSVQQRDLAFYQLQAGTAFFRLQSSPKGAASTFSFGLQINHDREHTEQRFSLSPSISARVLQTRKSKLSLGISLGIINWSSNYQDHRTGTLGDALLTNRTNFNELDAGMGAFYSFRNRLFNLEAEVFGSQLTGNLFSDELPGLIIYPHLYGRAALLIETGFGVDVGPLVWYGNPLIPRDSVPTTAFTELGFKAQFQDLGAGRDFWFTGAYRWNQAALNFGLGVRNILARDTINYPYKVPYTVGLNAGFSYPMQASSVFGPTAEIGLTLSFGKKKRRTDDTLRRPVVFWQEEVLLTHHKDKKLDPTGPLGLEAKAQIEPEEVELIYSFPDDNRLYLGQDYLFRDGYLEDVGAEWMGVEPLMKNMGRHVVHEALYPDSLFVRDPDSLEALDRLTAVEVFCFLRENEYSGSFTSEVRYQGELDQGGKEGLNLKLIFAEGDTVFPITSQRDMSILELAALKLHVLNKRLEYELHRYFGDEFTLLWQGQSTDSVDFSKQIIVIKYPRIYPDNSNQSTFQSNFIRFYFKRDPKFYQTHVSRKTWTPEEFKAMLTEKAKSKWQIRRENKEEREREKKSKERRRRSDELLEADRKQDNHQARREARAERAKRRKARRLKRKTSQPGIL